MTHAAAAETMRYTEPLRIKNVVFRNRILRAPIGGKMCYFDGSVTHAWKHFEKWFGYHGVGGIISTTMTVDEKRLSPLEYPSIADDRFVAPLGEAIDEIKATGVVYLLQIGDPGYATQASLLPQAADAKSASELFDFLYGYRNHSTPMSLSDIADTVQHFANGALRAKKANASGVEICGSKGYLLHQFLNPGMNRRTDAYGGSVDNRFRLLREVMLAVREAVGPDFVVGVRLSAIDYNYLPVNVRLPPVWPLRHWVMGNTLKETTVYAQELARLGADYIHVTRGCGFINPKESSGAYPVDQIRMYLNSVRHLSFKANLRATLLNVLPAFLIRWILGAGWHEELGGSEGVARAFKQATKGTGLKIIVNGGFQSRDLIEKVLRDESCDLVSLARPLLANPDLLKQFERGPMPARPCTFCNRCSVATAVYPLGCYDPTRFDSPDAMQRQILDWAVDPAFAALDKQVAADDVRR